MAIIPFDMYPVYDDTDMFPIEDYDEYPYDYEDPFINITQSYNPMPNEIIPELKPMNNSNNNIRPCSEVLNEMVPKDILEKYKAEIDREEKNINNSNVSNTEILEVLTKNISDNLFKKIRDHRKNRTRSKRKKLRKITTEEEIQQKSIDMHRKMLTGKDDSNDSLLIVVEMMSNTIMSQSVLFSKQIKRHYLNSVIDSIESLRSNIIKAGIVEMKGTALRDADIALATLRSRIWTLYTLKALSPTSIVKWINMTSTVGKRLGGWIRENKLRSSNSNK